MGKDITSPHDEFFKKFMGRVENARTYITHYLPAEITSCMDMDTLEVDIEGYVDDDLKPYFSDVVATVQLNDGQPSDIYILFEHKSGLDIDFQKIHFARQQGGDYTVVYLRPITQRNYFSESL
jgi:predicted transposase/invertase (TIGR01784 family)